MVARDLFHENLAANGFTDERWACHEIFVISRRAFVGPTNRVRFCPGRGPLLDSWCDGPPSVATG